MKNTYYRTLIILTILTTLMGATSSHAETAGPGKINLGGEIGWTNLLSGGNVSSLGYGLRLGYGITSNIELGLSGLMFSINSSSIFGSTSIGYTFLMVDALYRPEGMSQLYVGPMLGLGFISTSGSAVGGISTSGTSGANLSIGGTVGYDLSVTPQLKIGPKFNYLNNTIMNVSAFQANAAIKYQF